MTKLLKRKESEDVKKFMSIVFQQVECPSNVRSCTNGRVVSWIEGKVNGMFVVGTSSQSDESPY